MIWSMNQRVKIVANCFPEVIHIYWEDDMTHYSNFQVAECKQELKVIRIYISFLLPMKFDDILKALSAASNYI